MQEEIKSDFSIQIFMPNGREFAYNYEPRNIIQVKQFHYDHIPRGRIYPSGEYQGSFRWLVQNYNISVPWRGVFYVIHSDGSLEWNSFMWNNAGSGAPPSNWHGVGIAGNILGIVER